MFSKANLKFPTLKLQCFFSEFKIKCTQFKIPKLRLTSKSRAKSYDKEVKKNNKFLYLQSWITLLINWTEGKIKLNPMVTKLSKLLIFVRKLITTETETKINEQEYLLRFTLEIRSCDAHLMFIWSILIWVKMNQLYELNHNRIDVDNDTDSRLMLFFIYKEKNNFFYWFNFFVMIKCDASIAMHN